MKRFFNPRLFYARTITIILSLFITASLEAVTITKTVDPPSLVEVDGCGNFCYLLPGIEFTAAEIPGCITDVNVTIKFSKIGGYCSNPWPGSNAYNNEISFRIEGPTGNEILAKPNTWSSSVAVNDIVATFDQSAATVAGGPTPFSGTIQPNDGNLDNYNGQNGVGFWFLNAGDYGTQDALCIDYYSITITTEIDTTPPVLSLPADNIVSCSPNANFDPSATGLATATDYCDPSPTVTYSDGNYNTDCASNFSFDRTWTATDSNGNSTSLIQFISTSDTANPIISIPANTNVSCGSDSSPSATGAATATDSCDPNPTVTFSDATSPSGCGLSTIIRTWTATDCTGNSTAADQTITVEDSADPVLTIPADATVECPNAFNPSDTGMANATDTCDGNPTVTFSDANGTDACGLETVIRTWTATDCTGNSTSADQTIGVVDTADPVLTIPADVMVQCPGGTSPSDAGMATLTDTCDSNSVISFSDAVTTDNCGLETITRTWTATDCSGNSTSADQTITVEDSTDPVLSIPADATVQCSNGTDLADTGLATATDICDSNPTVTFSDAISADACGLETITRTWTATDCTGNSTSADQTITVEDSTDPVLSIPADTTVQCPDGTSPSDSGVATSTDICDGNSTVTFFDAITTDNCGLKTITRTWTATDCTGNSTAADQTITVVDTTDPVLTIPIDATVQCPNTFDPADTGIATATDTCDGDPVVTFSDASGTDACGLETVIRTWTATDCSGNSTSADQTIGIIDTTNPELSIPADATVQCPDSNDPTATGSATSTDTCDNNSVITFSDAVTTDNCGLETIIRTWTATDCSGNSTSADQTITVEDSTDPVLAIPADVTVQCSDGTSPSDIGMATSTDTCDGNPTVTFSDATNNNACGLGTITRTWLATDCSGNSTSADQTITIEDSTDPVLTIPADATVQCLDGTSPSEIGMATSTDTCDGNPTVTFSDATNNNACGLGTITRTWLATDCSGNSTSADQTITIEDSTDPVLTIPADATIQCLDGTSPSEIGMATSTDTCDGNPVITFSDATTADACGLETIIRTWTATDCTGNSTAADQTITVEDSTDPVLTIPADATVECPNAFDPSDTGMANATDTCDDSPIVTFADNINTDACGLETVIRTWTATDCSGNSTSGDQTITIEDSTDPVLTIPADATVQCLDGTSPSEIGLATSTDTCDGNPVITFSDATTADACGLETIIRTWTATDCTGNSTAADQAITVEDSTDPVLTIPADATVQCLDGTSPSEIGLATSTDTCDGNPIVTFSDATTADNCGLETILRTWTATDCTGNSTAADQTITVEDSTDPILTIPADATVQCPDGTNPSDTGMATSTDTCDSNPVITFSDAVSANNCGLETIIRTWTVTDCSGNSTSADQTITVEDTLDPNITFCPADLEVQCDGAGNVNEINDWLVTFDAEDDCASPILTNDYSGVSEGICANAGSVVVTFTATDCTGNAVSCTATVNIIDTTNPTISCPPTVNLDWNEEVPLADVSVPDASDICDPNVVVTWEGDDVNQDIDACLTVVTRTYKATDACGNSRACTQEFNIPTDFEAPTFVNCTTTDRIFCSYETVIFDTPAAMDNCSSASDIFIEQTAGNPSGSAFTTGTTLVTFTAIDLAGNSTTCSFNVIVLEELALNVVAETCDANNNIAITFELTGGNPELVVSENYDISISTLGNVGIPQLDNVNPSFGDTFMLTLDPATPLATLVSFSIDDGNGCILEDTYTTSFRCCISDAGFVTTDFQCAGDDIIVQVNNSQSDPAYSNYVILTDNVGAIIASFDVTASAGLLTIPYTDFENVYGGTGLEYSFYSYSVLTGAEPTPDPIGTTSLAVNVGEIVASGSACFDLSAKKELFVAAPWELLSGTANAFEGVDGGVSPFYFNTHQIIISGGEAPYTYNWDTDGYVRHAITGVGEIRVIYADDANWIVTVTDANGCANDEVIFTNSNGVNPILDIESFIVESDNKTTFSVGEGSIAITATGGDTSCGDYSYDWSGPLGFTSSANAMISDLRFGWYTVTVSDCSGDTTVGWYWVPYSVQNEGSNGPDRGKYAEQSGIQAYPNPFANSTTIDFSIVETSNAIVELFSISGNRILELFNGELQGGTSVSLPFEAGPLAAGTYIVKLRTNKGENISQKLILLD